MGRVGFIPTEGSSTRGGSLVGNAKSHVKVGDKAPSFTALDDRGQSVSLEDFKGRVVVLYFYPKDDTPG